MNEESKASLKSPNTLNNNSPFHSIPFHSTPIQNYSFTYSFFFFALEISAYCNNIQFAKPKKGIIYEPFAALNIFL